MGLRFIGMLILSPIICGIGIVRPFLGLMLLISVMRATVIVKLLLERETRSPSNDNPYVNRSRYSTGERAPAEETQWPIASDTAINVWATDRRYQSGPCELSQPTATAVC